MHLNKLYLPTVFMIAASLLTFMFAITTTQPIENIGSIAQASMLGFTLFACIYAWSTNCVIEFGNILSAIARAIITSWVAFLSYVIWLDRGLQW